MICLYLGVVFLVAIRTRHKCVRFRAEKKVCQAQKPSCHNLSFLRAFLPHMRRRQDEQQHAGSSVQWKFSPWLGTPNGNTAPGYSGTSAIETALSIFSATLTAYFWLVKARQEQPNLTIYQLHDFRTSLDRRDPEKKTKRLGVAQVIPGGVLVTNHSVRQNSIVRFDCHVWQMGRWFKGNWGYVEDDKPPWNLAPQSSIAISLASYFDVPEDYETPDDLKFRVDFLTASGKRFSHVFTRQAPVE